MQPDVTDGSQLHLGGNGTVGRKRYRLFGKRRRRSMSVKPDVVGGSQLRLAVSGSDYQAPKRFDGERFRLCGNAVDD